MSSTFMRRRSVGALLFVLTAVTSVPAGAQDLPIRVPGNLDNGVTVFVPSAPTPKTLLPIPQPRRPNAVERPLPVQRPDSFIESCRRPDPSTPEAARPLACRNVR